MAYGDKIIKEIEEKRAGAAVAVGAYIATLKDGRKILDPKLSAREKIDILLPPIVKFNEIIKIGRM